MIKVLNITYYNHTLFVGYTSIKIVEWMFFDTAKINVKGGDGGDGCMAMRRVTTKICLFQNFEFTFTISKSLCRNFDWSLEDLVVAMEGMGVTFTLNAMKDSTLLLCYVDEFIIRQKMEQMGWAKANMVQEVQILLFLCLLEL